MPRFLTEGLAGTKKRLLFYQNLNSKCCLKVTFLYSIHFFLRLTLVLRFKGDSLIICPRGSRYEANKARTKNSSLGNTAVQRFRWRGATADRHIETPVRKMQTEPLQKHPHTVQVSQYGDPPFQKAASRSNETNTEHSPASICIKM